MTLNDDGTGFSVEGEAVEEAKGIYEESKTWLNLCARFGRGVAACSPSAIAEAVTGACEELVVGEEMWLYLVDELTGLPVIPEVDDETTNYIPFASPRRRTSFRSCCRSCRSACTRRHW